MSEEDDVATADRDTVGVVDTPLRVPVAEAVEATLRVSDAEDVARGLRVSEEDDVATTDRDTVGVVDTPLCVPVTPAYNSNKPQIATKYLAFNGIKKYK